MTGHEGGTNRWLAVIKSEYREMPGLQLTKRQARRLWGLEPEVCDELLKRLEASHFLRVNPRGCYVLADNDRGVRRQA